MKFLHNGLNCESPNSKGIKPPKYCARVQEQIRNQLYDYFYLIFSHSYSSGSLLFFNCTLEAFIILCVIYSCPLSQDQTRNGIWKNEGGYNTIQKSRTKQVGNYSYVIGKSKLSAIVNIKQGNTFLRSESRTYILDDSEEKPD